MNAPVSLTSAAFSEMIADILEMKSGVRYKHAEGGLGRFVNNAEFAVDEFSMLDLDECLWLLMQLPECPSPHPGPAEFLWLTLWEHGRNPYGRFRL